MLSNLASGRNSYINLSEKMSMAFFSSPYTELIQQSPHTKIDEIQTSGVKVRKEQESAYQNNVYFKDPLSNAYVNVGLSDENLSKLKEVFGENAAKSEGDKILLKGKAEEFVSSWYADIAYKRGYIRADENNDGFLNVEERKKTNSFSEGKLVFAGKNVFLLGDDKFYQKFSSINSEDGARINQYTSSSIEEELNRMIELDKDANGSLTLGELWQDKFTQYLDKVVGDKNKECKGGYVPPSFEEVFYDFIKTMKDAKEMLKKQLKKHLKQAMKAIDSNTSTKELFENIMKQENGIEALNKIKEQNVNLNSTTRRENEATFFANKEDEAIFNEIAKLTKLDKDTLAYNLANNENFEENIISIVQELTQSLDKAYALNSLNLSHSSQKILDIKA